MTSPPSGPPIPNGSPPFGVGGGDGGEARDLSDVRGKYRIVRPLKVGGTASIYLAVMRGENAFSREVVIKRPLPHLVADNRARLMFIDEAHIAARLQHQNICQVLDLVSRDDELYLVLEYLRGVDLREVIKDCIARQKFLSAELAVWIGVEIAAGLHHSHEATGLDGQPLQLVHRDVSPKNIRLTYEGSVKLIDFGIAQALNRATETAAGMIKGTLGYMSPEQILGDVLDRRSDVFAFGICLFQMLTCRNPFDGANLTERVRRLTHDPIPRLRDFQPALDDEIEGIVARCLARDVDDRYPSMQLVQDELEKYLGRLGVVSPRQRLIAYLDRHFSGPNRVDPQLAHALHEESQTVGPIDLSVPLAFPDDESGRSTTGESTGGTGRTSGRRTGSTYTPSPSERRTEAEQAGETRPLVGSNEASARPPAPGPGWVRIAGIAGLFVVLAGVGLFLLRPSPSVTVIRVPTEASDVGFLAATNPKDAGGLGDTGPPDLGRKGKKKRDAVRPREYRIGGGKGGREQARLFFLAARSREKLGASAEARLLYELAFEASKPAVPASIYLNLGLLARRTGNPGRARACLRTYVQKRPNAPDASRIRTLLAVMPEAKARRCVRASEGRRARRRYAREGALIDGWVDEAVKAELR